MNAPVECNAEPSIAPWAKEREWMYKHTLIAEIKKETGCGRELCEKSSRCVIGKIKEDEGLTEWPWRGEKKMDLDRWWGVTKGWELSWGVGRDEEEGEGKGGRGGESVIDISLWKKSMNLFVCGGERRGNGWWTWKVLLLFFTGNDFDANYWKGGVRSLIETHWPCF